MKKGKRSGTPKKRGITLARLREMVLALPGTSERPSYGTPGYRANDQLIVRVLPDDQYIIVRVSLEQREALLDALPDVFSVTDHYKPHPMVIVRRAAIDEGLLKDLLEEAWGLVEPGGARHKGKRIT
jgi:hypothetical protein